MLDFDRIWVTFKCNFGEARRMLSMLGGVKSKYRPVQPATTVIPVCMFVCVCVCRVCVCERE